MQKFQNVLLGDIISRMVPADDHHSPEDSRWSSHWLRVDAKATNPEAKAPIMIKMDRSLVNLQPDMLVTIGVTFDRGKKLPGLDRESRDLLYLRIEGLTHDDNIPTLELRHLEWGAKEDATWKRGISIDEWRWFGDDCRGAFVLVPQGKMPRVTIFPEHREVLWEGPAVVRIPNPLPSGAIRKPQYNGVKYQLPSTSGMVDIYDGRRNTRLAWGKVQHIRKTTPGRNGNRQYEYFTVSDAPEITPAHLKCILNENGLKQVIPC